MTLVIYDVYAMNSCRGFVKQKTLKNKCLDVDSIFSEWIQEPWLMFEKGDLIKVHLLNMQVVCSCFEADGFLAFRNLPTLNYV